LLLAMLASQGHIVNTQHAWTALRIRVDERMQVPQERLRADGDAGFARQTRTALAAGLQGKCCEQFGRAIRTTGIARQGSVDGEGALESPAEVVLRQCAFPRARLRSTQLQPIWMGLLALVPLQLTVTVPVPGRVVGRTLQLHETTPFVSADLEVNP
jgi:hypothetical protein